MLFDDLTCSESEFQRVRTATEKPRVPAWILTLGTDNKWKPDKRSSLGMGAEEQNTGRKNRTQEETRIETFLVFSEILPTEIYFI